MSTFYIVMPWNNLICRFLSLSQELVVVIGIIRFSLLDKGISSSHNANWYIAIAQKCVKTNTLLFNCMGPLNIRWCSCTPICHCWRDITWSSNYPFDGYSYTNNAHCEGIRYANPQTKVHYLMEITTLWLLIEDDLTTGVTEYRYRNNRK